MPRINLLSRDIAELIAAGEVIDRPASVIKELVENSIDAGAKNITVEIKNGGSVYMRITDDGCGIPAQDVPTAFLRHATSKIISRGDLDSIMTLGFRGEALASVAAVARVELMTKERSETLGVRYRIEGGEEISREETGCPDGTMIIVRDLFYNIPARRKFLKKDVTEGNAVTGIIQKIALSHPEVAFRVLRDNHPDFRSSGDGKLYSAIYSVYGREFAETLREVTPYTLRGITVSGFTVRPLYSRPNRSFQTFFINGRFVRSATCSAAISQAYDNLVMTGKFPACVLMLEMPAKTVDVNVHPAKAEVRFSDEKVIFDAVFFAVKNALMEDERPYEMKLAEKKTAEPIKYEPVYTQTAMTFRSRENEDIIANAAEDERENPPEAPPAPRCENAIAPHVSVTPDEAFPIPKDEAPPADISPEIPDGFTYITPEAFVKKAAPCESPKAEEKASEIRVVGEVLGTYIIAEAQDSLILIDKHAAHERILFEELKSSAEKPSAQLLLTPVRIMPGESELSALCSAKDRLEQLGFYFEAEGNEIVLTAVPAPLSGLDFDALLCEAAQKIIEARNDLSPDVLDDIRHTAACKAAIKAGDKNDLRELEALAKKVYLSPALRHCPHGRPVMFALSRSKIERQFGR